MDKSPELEQWVRRLFARFSSGDRASIAQLCSRQEGVLLLGTAPEEWLEGWNAIRQAHGTETPGMGGAHLHVGDLRAYVEGAVGWAVDRSALRLPNGTVLPMRHTLVLHREEDEWRIVYAPISFGVADEQALR